MTISIGLPFFASRGADRDLRNDLARLGQVRSALEAALESATRERAGLQRRLDDYCTQIASLLDNSPDYSERSAREEEAIVVAERSVATARSRLEQLDTHIQSLSDIRSQVAEPALEPPGDALQSPAHSWTKPKS